MPASAYRGKHPISHGRNAQRGKNFFRNLIDSYLSGLYRVPRLGTPGTRCPLSYDLPTSARMPDQGIAVSNRKGNRAAVSAAVIAVGAFLPLLAAAEGQKPAKVIDLRVQGNKRMSPQAVLASVKTRLGQDYNQSVVNGDKQRLLETGQFESVVVTKTQTDKGVIVTFIVAERPLVTKLAFIGNKAFKDEDLAKELPFNESDPLNRFNVGAGRDAILRKYKNAGFHNVSVKVGWTALTREKRAVYHIREGTAATVRKVTFEGNRHFIDLRLRQMVSTKARVWPFIAGHLDLEQVDHDVTSLRNLYVSEGFLDCEVGRSLEFSFDKKKVTVKFVIKEGGRYRVDRVIFKGNTVFSNEELARRLKLKRGEHFTSISLRRDITKLEDTYGELGYIEASVKASRQFLPPNAPVPPWAAALEEFKPALLNVVFTINEADRFRFGRVDIRGNKVTQSRIIRRELRFFPEQDWNSKVVGQSRHRLLETRLFEEVTITPLKTADPRTRDVLVTVKEGKTAEFLVGVGVSTNSGVLGSVSLTQRNFDLFAWPRSWGQFIRGQSFKGAGQTLRIVAEPGTEMMRFHLSWFEPYLYDKDYSLGVKGFFWRRDRDDYDEQRGGGVVTLGHRFKNRWYGELATRVVGVELDNLDNNIAEEIEDDAGTSFLTGFKGTLVRDRTDSRWMPTRGDRFRFSYEQVVGDHTFGNFQGDYRYYRTLFLDALDRKHILATRLAAGSIVGDAPVFERYYGGGIGSIRGFEYRGISPRGENTDDAIGGDFMFFAGAEYTFPIIGRELKGVVFMDSGTVEDSFTVSTYRVSAGVGLRWVIPMLGPVPLSLDFGFPISKHGDDDTQMLTFSLGWTF